MVDPTKHYYDDLEVASEEGPDGIHRAYRRLAKECHPDRVGAEGESKFRAIQEAYEVLSDPLLSGNTTRRRIFARLTM